MRGEDLVTLLSGYVAEMENTGRQLGGNSGASRTLAEGILTWSTEGRDAVLGTSELAGRLLQQVSENSTDAAASAPDPTTAGMAPSAILTSALRSAGASVSERLGGLTDDEAGTGFGALALGRNLITPSILSLLERFRGRDEHAALAEFERAAYTERPTRQVVEGLTDNAGRVSGLDTQFDGTPRVVDRAPAPGQRIDVHIEALDARSFLDRKEDIAEAVRQAMLTSGVLGQSLTEY